MQTPEPGVALKSFLVVTGSSAGGIDPLGAFVASLPADFAAPIVIAQHLDPTHKSHLTQILAQRTQLPVEAVTGRAELLPGRIYVVPPDRDVEIVDSHARAYIDTRPGPKPSIDRLFGSAAQAYGDGVIAVVFSGMGSDGLAGARIVKEYGGTVVIQELSTASHPSMPGSIPPTLIDIETAPETMGNFLSGLVRGVQADSLPDDQAVLRTLLAAVRDRSGIDFSQYKMPTIVRRLSRLMVAGGFESLSDYARYVSKNEDAYQRLVSAFLIKVTEFFRDAPLFEELRERVLPRLIEEARSNGGELRIWSAGASTGEEPYSIAILCAELLRDDAYLTVRIFATDVDEQAIAFARRGVYSADMLKEVPQGLIERYFVPLGTSFEVSKRIRNMTVFGQHDLAQRAPFPRVDLCLCRNVLIYFTRELQKRALQLFAFSLRDAGVLVLGKAESTSLLPDSFRAVDATRKIYERHGERILIPPTRLSEPANGQYDFRAQARSASRGVPALEAQRLDRGNPSEPIGSLLLNAPVGVIVVDRKYDIVALNAAARVLLQIHGMGIGEDLVHLAQSLDATNLRDFIDAVFRGESPEPRDVPATDSGTGARRVLALSSRRDGAPPRPGDSVALFFTDVTGKAEEIDDLRRQVDAEQARGTEFASRIDSLSKRQQILLAANEQLSAANSELRSYNEQLLINSEEAASANEEIETMNEEMQASNEELETLNEELQATVEELNTSSDELAARSRALATTAEENDQTAGRGRNALLSLLDKLHGPSAIVQSDGTVVSASPGIDAAWFASGRPGWWRSQSNFSGNGATYRIGWEPLPVPDGSYDLVSFTITPP